MANTQPVEATDHHTFESEPQDLDDLNLSTLENVIDQIGGGSGADLNIWDIETGEDDAVENIAVIPSPQIQRPGPDAMEEHPVVPKDNLAVGQSRRNRTRLIGFDTSGGNATDLFASSDPATPVQRVQFPVGWVLVVDGPGRGHCFALTSGMAQIGRDDDQAIQLDFGDVAISRNNHAAIVFDPDAQEFLLGHGGKANIVRLNGDPVISNETLDDGDIISLGETVLQLKTLCGPDFDWNSRTAEEDEFDDMAIA